jgi:hypothetical protein
MASKRVYAGESLILCFREDWFPESTFCYLSFCPALIVNFSISHILRLRSLPRPEPELLPGRQSTAKRKRRDNGLTFV